MLSALAIKNFAIIDDIRITFSKGLTVLTGETGAGKSIIIQAANLLLGQRASTDLVRTGEETAELELFFDITPGSRAAALLESQDIDSSEGLIIRRLISQTAKSRIFINSRQVTMQMLKEVTLNLAGVSSQHAHQELLDESCHMDILDRFAGTLDLREKVAQCYRRILPMEKELEKLSAQTKENAREQEFIRYQLDEIRDADIQPDEDRLLDDKRKQLMSASQIFNCMADGVDELHEKQGSVVETLTRLRNELDRFSQTDSGLVPLAGRLNSVLFEIEDLVSDLRSHASGIDMDPQSLEAIEQRLDLIQKLKRKYGPELDAVFEKYAALQEQLEQIGGSEARIEELKKNLFDQTATLVSLANELSRKRHEAGEKLASLAQEQLRGLEMDKAVFQVHISPVSSIEAGPDPNHGLSGMSANGMDKVVFLLSPNPGEAPRPLNRIASGGELSRIVLALKAVLSRVESQQTLIFDEVDAGVGGATAEKVGEKLLQLSSAHQVICITHLAQIAKYANHQFSITKQVKNSRTSTRIIPLTSREQRVAEIARMLAGKQVSSAALTHARDLLDGAGT